MPDSTTTVYRDWNQQELDAQYNNRAAAPDFARQTARYRTLTDSAKQAFHHVENLSYGTAPEERLDLYVPTGSGAPVLVFVHGGAWQMLGKDDSGFPAHALLPAGALVASLNFGHVPDASLDTMVDQVRRAVAWLWQHVADHGGDPDRLFLAGHSSGAHLVGQCLTADWPTDYGCPADAIKGALFISGLGDLEPVRLSYRNALLHLQAQDVGRLSLVHQRPTVSCPLIVAYADGDTAEFQRQTREVGHYWQAQGLPTQALVIPDRCHYQIVLDLAEADSVLCRSLANLMALVPPAPG